MSSHFDTKVLNSCIVEVDLGKSLQKGVLWVMSLPRDLRISQAKSMALKLSCITLLIRSDTGLSLGFKIGIGIIDFSAS